MKTAVQRRIEASVFGAVDGLTVALGVMVPLLHKPQALVLAVVGAGIAEAVGMAGGDWLSDSEGSWVEAASLGLSTGVVSIIPALPFAFLAPKLAQPLALVLMLALAVAITVTRRLVKHQSWRRAFGETFGILTVVAVCVTACSLLLGGA